MVYIFYDLETGVEKIERRGKLTVSQVCCLFVGQWHLLLKTLKHNLKTIASGILLWLGCSKSSFFFVSLRYSNAPTEACTIVCLICDVWIV